MGVVLKLTLCKLGPGVTRQHNIEEWLEVNENNLHHRVPCLFLSLSHRRSC